MILRAAFFLVALGLAAPVSAQEKRVQFSFSELPSDGQISEWLKTTSSTYRDAYDAVVEHTYVDEIQFKSVSSDPLKFNDIGVFFVGRMVEIRISDKLTGAERVRTLAYEVFNTYLNEEHRQLDAGAAAGFFSAREFAVAHEIYEYEAWRIYRRCLFDLEKELGEGNLPAGLFYWTATQKVRDYKLPPLLAYLKHMEDSQHMKHYLDWFERHYSQKRRRD